MNCKPGDMALVVSGGELIKAGAVVLCVDFLGTSTDRGGRLFHDVWAVEYRGTRRSPNGLLWGAPDANLRPLRDSDGEDEMLRIAGLPNKQPAEA